METNLNQQLYMSNTISGNYLHNTIATFLNEVSDILKTTYGPYGSHGLIQGQVKSEPTKDGLTLLSHIKTNKTIPKSVHTAILDVARKQVEQVGDGSTSTELLLTQLYNALRKIQVDENIAPSVLKKKMRKVVDILLTELKEQAIPIVKYDEDGTLIVDQDKLYDIIYTSLDGDIDLTDKIVEMFTNLNSIDPLIITEYSPTTEHRFELVKGVELDGTIIRPDVFFDGYSRKTYENPYILVVNGRADIPINVYMELAQFTRKNDCDVIFLCTGISEAILENSVSMNNVNPGLFNRIAFFQMRQTAHNDEFLDTCAALGANSIDSETLSKVTNIGHLNTIISTCKGMATKVLLSELCARFNEPKSNMDMINDRITNIDAKIEDIKKDPSSHNDRLTDLELRKAFLTKNYAKFYVGGNSSQRKAINYELAKDAIPQAISAMKHGVVVGCNVTIPSIIESLFTSGEHVLDGLDNQLLELISNAYYELFIYIVENKVNSYEKAKDMVMNHITNNGYTPLNIRDSRNVLNSADTDRAILENATDMAVLLATTKSFLSEQCEFDIINK